MLLVKTYIAPSKIHGMGLFAGEFIAEDTVIWEFCDPSDSYICADAVKDLPEIAQNAIHHFCPLSDKGYLVSADNSRFFNHSNEPNTYSTEVPDRTIAARDIEEGEELLEDYAAFDKEATLKIKPFSDEGPK